MLLLNKALIIGKPLAVAGLFLVCVSASASTWRPNDRLLTAICYIESTGGLFVHGDRGMSLGDFQIRKPAWQDVSAWRKARNLTTYDYRRHVYNKTINRQYAADYLTIIHNQLRLVFKRNPTEGELYAAYNMGVQKFGDECGYNLKRVNKTTAEKCERIKFLIKEDASALSLASN